MKAWLRALGAALVTALLLHLVNDGAGPDCGYTYSGDEILTMVMARSIQEGGHPQLPARLRAPEGADLRPFPMRLPLEWLTIKAFCLTGLDCFQASYGTWLIFLGLAAALATRTFEELDLPPPLAFTLGCAYGLQPFSWETNINHFHLLTPWIPGACLSLLCLARGERMPRWLYGNALALGVSSLYFTFFFCLLGPFAALLGGRRGHARAFLLALCLVPGVAVQLAPTAVTGGPNNGTIGRSTVEAELYSLKLRNLLCPRPYHPLPPLAGLADLLQDGFPDAETETGTTRLGTAASLGLLLSLPILAMACLGRRRDHPWLVPACLLIWIVFLLGSTSGTGPLFNALFTNKFRCYNRMVVYLQWFALAVVGALCPRRLQAWTPLLIPLLAIDQFYPRQMEYPSIRQCFARDRQFVEAVERGLPPGAMVFVLPDQSALTGVWPWYHPYEGAKPYLQSRALRWSWGWLPGANQNGWHDELAAMPLAGALQAVRQRGFGYLWVNAVFYQDDQTGLLAALPGLLGPPLLSSSDGNYQVYRLDLRPSTPPAPISVVQDEAITDANAARVELRHAIPPRGKLHARPGQQMRFSMVLCNGGTQVLRPHGPLPISVSYHWTSRRGRMRIFDGWRTAIPITRPGQTLPVGGIRVEAPRKPGEYRLQLRLVQETKRWWDKPVPEDVEVVVDRF